MVTFDLKSCAILKLEEWNREEEKREKLDLVENKELESVAMKPSFCFWDLEWKPTLAKRVSYPF